MADFLLAPSKKTTPKSYDKSSNTNGIIMHIHFKFDCIMTAYCYKNVNEECGF